jgi:hypothetical protein
MFDFILCAEIWNDRHVSTLGLAVNFLLIESLQRFYQYYGDELQVCLTSIYPAVDLRYVPPGRMSNREWGLHEPC